MAFHDFASRQQLAFHLHVHYAGVASILLIKKHFCRQQTVLIAMNIKRCRVVWYEKLGSLILTAYRPFKLNTIPCKHLYRAAYCTGI